MQHAASTLWLRPEKREEYIERHRHVWPELIEAAREAGIRNHSVFLRGNELFLYAEADDLEKAMALFVRSEIEQRWDREMKPFFDLTANDQQWQEAFHS
jgi:L-rhamnose mutarotase